jgi:hypothetical protein
MVINCETNRIGNLPAAVPTAKHMALLKVPVVDEVKPREAMYPREIALGTLEWHAR